MLTSSLSSLAVQPPIIFSHRYRNEDFEKRTISQLQQNLQLFGIDATTLHEKWEYVHVYERALRFSNRKRIVEHNDSRLVLSFESLPGEIRNKIYKYALVSDECITIYYNKDGSGFLHLPVGSLSKKQRYFNRVHHSANEQTLALNNLCLMNHHIRDEARSTFFEKNQFAILHCKGGCSSAQHCGTSVNWCPSSTKFLCTIGPSRQFLTSLKIDDSLLNSGGGLSYSFIMLSLCTKLRTLKIMITENDFKTPDSPFLAALKGTPDSSSALSALAEKLSLKLSAFPSLTEVAVGSPEDYPEWDPIHEVAINFTTLLQRKLNDDTGMRVTVKFVHCVPQ